MSEEIPSRLFKISLLITLTGLFLIFLFIEFIPRDILSVKEVIQQEEGLYKIKGTITSSQHYAGLQILEMEYLEQQEFLYFAEPERSFEPGQIIQAQVQKYDGQYIIEKVYE